MILLRGVQSINFIKTKLLKFIPIYILFFLIMGGHCPHGQSLPPSLPREMMNLLI